MDNKEEIKQEVDARQKKCPMPIILMAKAIKTVEKGDLIKVLATDCVFELDIKKWCEKTGNKLISFEHKETEKIAIIRKEE